MAPSDEVQTAAEAPQGTDPNAGAAAYANMVDPFHLAIAELRHDTEDMNVNGPHAGAAAAPARQTILLSQPVRGLELGEWIGVGVAALVLGLLGGLISQAFRSKTLPGPDPTLAKDVAGARSGIGAIGRQMDELEKRLAAQESKPAEKPDLSGLESQVRTLADEVKRDNEERRQALGQIKGFDTRTGALAAEVKQNNQNLSEIRKRLDAVEANAKKAAAAPAPTTADADRGEDKPKEEATLAKGAELFKQGRYKEALGVFNKLELSNPDDARVWYFAALTNGFATGEWEGGTAELVNHGIERERAGTPDSAQIDEAFKDLTVNTGKTWLEGYRQRAKP